MNRDIMETLTGGEKSDKASGQLNGTGVLSTDLASTGLMSTMPVVSIADHPLTAEDLRRQQLQEQLERQERQEAIISEMDTVSTLTTVKPPKFDPNIRTKIKNTNSTKASHQKSNGFLLHDPSLRKLKSSKGSRNSSNQLKHP